MAKLVLIDGNAILHRAYHALPPLTTKRGEPINAVYGLVAMLLKVVQDLRPTHLVVCFDEKAPTFRHQEFAAYQAQRPPMADELSGQFEKARRFLEAANIPIYSKAGFEGDDVLGTLAKQAVQLSGFGSQLSDSGLSDFSRSVAEELKAGRLQSENRQQKTDDRFEVVIVTGDRDLLQLVNDKVKLYMPVAGLSAAKLFGKEETIDKTGVSPEQIADFKALVGDPSDNYSGVSGVGPKTAISLLSKYKNLDGIYKNLDKMQGGIKEKLQKGKKDASLSLRLATIVTDAPVSLDIKKAGKWDLDSPKVISLFEDFGFKTLKERIKKVGKEIDQQRQMSLI